MPIKPENAARYPKNWKQIRVHILERAGNKCEECGVPNYAYRAKNGDWATNYDMLTAMTAMDENPIRIVLTIAHLDHQPENCQDDNLKAMCQRCHLTYDAKEHAVNARATRKNRKAIGELF